MKNKTPKGNTDTRNRIAILSLCFVVLAYLAPSVAMNEILASFPNAAESTVMLMLSLPSITGIAGILLAPLLQKWLSYKTQSLLAMGLLLVAGALSLLFYTSLPMLVTGAALMGLSYGILATAYPLLIGLHFSDKLRAFMMGVATGVLQLGRLAFMLLGGFLADIRWQYVYIPVAFAAVAFVAVLIFLPDTRIASAEKTERVRLSLRKCGELLQLCLLGAAAAVLYFVTVTHISVHVEGNGLGTAATTGVANSVGLIAAIIMSILFSKAFRVTGKFTLAAGFGLLGLGLLCCGLFVTLPTLFLGLILANLAMGLISPYLMLRGGLCTEPGTEGKAMAILLSCINVGYFSSPYISGLFKGNTASIYLVFGIAAAIICIREIVFRKCIVRRTGVRG